MMDSDDTGSPLAGASREELLELIRQEEEKHLLEMETLAHQKARMVEMLHERKDYFRSVITNVTKLRIELSEIDFEAATKLTDDSDDPQDAVTSSRQSPTGASTDLNTGSERVDKLLGKLLLAFTKGKSKLQPLLCALDAAVQPEGTPAVKEGAPYPPLLNPQRQQHLALYNKTTSVFFVSRNEIRGLKPWWEKHCKSCQTCGARQRELAHQQHQNFSSTGGKHTPPVGSMSLPQLEADATKSYHRINVMIQREPCLQEREEAKSLDAIRLSGILGVQRNGHPLSDPAAAAQGLQLRLQAAAQSALSALLTRIMSAAWMQHSVATQDCTTELKVVIEMFLHSIGVAATVGVVEQKAEFTYLRVGVAVTLPIHVACLRPLIDAARQEAHQRFVVKNVLEPLVHTLCQVVSLTDKAPFFCSVLDRVVDVMESMRSSSESTHCSDSSSVIGVKKQQCYNIAHALAIHQSQMSFLCAAPTLDRQATKKQKTLDIANEVLRLFLAPESVTLPVTSSPDVVDFVLRLDRIPTAVLEVLNKTFTSSDRIPSSRRTGTLDAVVSPQTKVALGLKLFSEMVVEVYRPYAPTCGVVIAEEEEKSQSFFKKSPLLAPECTPRADLPVDIIRGNIAVHEQATKVLLRIDEERQRKQKHDVEERSKKLMDTVRERVEAAALARNLREEIADLGLKAVAFYQAEAGILLPFGTDALDVDDAQRPLLYAVFQLTEKE